MYFDGCSPGGVCCAAPHLINRSGISHCGIITRIIIDPFGIWNFMRR